MVSKQLHSDNMKVVQHRSVTVVQHSSTTQLQLTYHQISQ